MDETDPELLKLQRCWIEWNYCTNSFASESFTEMTELVPENTVFLAKHLNGLKSDNVTCNDPITRTGTINTGAQKIFMPVYGAFFVDYSDDYLSGICSNSSAESEAARYRDAASEAIAENDPKVAPSMIMKVDNFPLSPLFIYDNRTYFLMGCPDNRTSEEYETLHGNAGDLCDSNPFQQLKGLDVYPSLGWWGLYNHTWRHKETHTFEFGFTGQECSTVKYVLTAKDVCDFKVLGVGFCPLLWIKHLFERVFSWFFG